MSSEVKRYEVWRADAELPDETMVVLASDYDALEAECARLREQHQGSESQAEYQRDRAEHFETERDAALAELAALKGGQEAVAWRVTGAGGLTVTPQYPSWAEDDTRLSIEPLYLAPPAQASAWVAVSERLPESGLDVLVVGVKHGAVYHTVAGLFHDKWASQETEEATRFEPTHWQPIPAAPTPGASDGKGGGV